MENRIEREKCITLFAANEFKENYLKDILSLEEKCFPEDWQYEDAGQYYKEMLSDKENINIFLRDHGKTVGYVLARFHNKETGELSEYDPEFKDQENVFYIETIQILPEFQGKGGAKKLLLAVCEEAGKRGINKFSIHARKINGFSESVKKIFADRIVAVREIESWEPAEGEPYEYIEWEV